MGNWGAGLLQNDRAADFVEKLARKRHSFWQPYNTREVLLAALKDDDWPEWPTPLVLLGAAAFLIREGHDLSDAADLVAPFILWELSAAKLEQWPAHERQLRKKLLEELLERIVGSLGEDNP